MRAELELAVTHTALVPRAMDARAVHIQFLGDELRLGFACSIASADEIVDFVDQAVEHLGPSGTSVRIVILVGPLTPSAWLGCIILKGITASKAQRWLDNKELKGKLKPGYIAADETFSFQVLPRGLRRWHPIPIGSEVVNMFGVH
ncbi:MAG TPA: hypothetical protein VGB92_01850 [Longimicrobium sp.]